MKRSTYITTSWDDGHPLDLRVAELLAKYGLAGTFYVPKTAENGTMTAAQVAELNQAFEIGAHTVNHVELTRTSEHLVWQELVDSKAWVEDCTGKPCALFCPPKGKYSVRHLEQICRAGYGIVRNVEMLSLDFPRPEAGLSVMPTTVQAYSHGLISYARNTMKRRNFRNLWRYLAQGCPSDWRTLARSMMEEALRFGGVFHLWGHSWELEQTGQWANLEEILRFLSQFTSQAPALTNGQICGATPSPAAAAHESHVPDARPAAAVVPVEGSRL